MIFVDKSLSQRLERAEARSNADFVETRATLMPDVGAEWIDVDGTYALFDGPGSPCTQAFGFGLFAEPSADQLDEIEAFFRSKSAPVLLEVSPLADAAVLGLLSGRGYRPAELTSVMYREIARAAEHDPVFDPPVATRIIGRDEVDAWARTSANGWATEHAELAEFLYGFGRISAQCNGSFPFIAEIDGEPVATGMLFIHANVALLAGASTVPAARNHGAQNALLDARLRFAAERGCDLAAMGALPGSLSQKNAQKNGFQIAYTRTKWQLADVN